MNLTLKCGGINVKNYLSYLEKLQSKMDYSEGVDMKKVKEYIDIRDSCRRLSQLCGSFLLLLLPLLWVVRSHVDSLTSSFLTFCMLLALLFIGGSCVANAATSKHHEYLANVERDKIYLSNCNVIKNEIVNDGEEQIRQLILWNEMCELSDEDTEKYKNLLRIVKSVCRDYVEIYK